LLPDFSKLSFDETNEQPEQKQVSTALTDTDLLNTLRAFVECGNKTDSCYSRIPTYNDSAYLPAMAYCSMFENLAPIGIEEENAFAGVNLKTKN
jgi:hypothetical protein